MAESLLKHFSIDIQKRFEKETPQGQLAVYQTKPFGMMLTINEHIIISEQDSFFHHEMMTHPALFTHHHPQKVMIIGHYFGLLEEVLKHSSIQQIYCVTNSSSLDEIITEYFPHFYPSSSDSRVTYQIIEHENWFAQCEPNSIDIIIQTLPDTDFLLEHSQAIHRILRPQGILIQSCHTSLLQLNTLKSLFQSIHQIGFHSYQTLHFPQPSYPQGWRTLIMATNYPLFKRIREKDIYNRSFTTRYYNYDTHKAALALPEFIRQTLEEKA